MLAVIGTCHYLCSIMSNSLWPYDCSPPGSSVLEIFQARILERVVVSSPQGFFLTQGSNLQLLCLLHWQILYHWTWGLPVTSLENPRYRGDRFRLLSMGSQRVRHDWVTSPFNFKISSLKPPGGASGKDSTCQCRRSKRHRFDPWVGKIPWRRKWQPTPVFLPGKSHPLSMGSQRVITTEHTHPPQIPDTGRFQSQPCATPVLGQLPGAPWTSLLRSYSWSYCELLILYISQDFPPASHTLGILLIGLWWTKARLVWNLLRQLYHTENHHQGTEESRHPGEKRGKAGQWGAMKASEWAKGVTGPHPSYTL